MRTGLCIALLLFMPGLLGCGGGTFRPFLPEVSTFVHIKSLPGDAEVYNIDDRGNVDKLLGKTPLTITVKTAPSRDLEDNCKGPFHAWSPAGFWSGSREGAGHSYKVSLYVTKQGYSNSYVSTTLVYQCGNEDPGDRDLTVRLEPAKRDDQLIKK